MPPWITNAPYKLSTLRTMAPEIVPSNCAEPLSNARRTPKRRIWLQSACCSVNTGEREWPVLTMAIL